MIKKLLLFVLLAFVLTTNAQTESNAKSITSIKKSKQYIYAEITDSTEEAAYNAAKAELGTQVEKYIVDSGMADDAKAVVVRNIGRMTNKITVLRGDMHRVFIYVKKSDITASRSDVDVVKIEKSNTEEAKAEKPKTVSEKTETEETTVGKVTADGNDIANLPANGFFSVIKGARATTLAAIAKAKDMSSAEKILAEQRLLMNVKGYGVMGDCRSVAQSYWVVPCEKGVTVLSPVRDGQRWNYKTGKTDSLDNYSQKLWFRM